MKRTFYLMLIAAALLLAASCVNVMDEMWYEDNRSILVMNAQLLQDEHTHKIYLHNSVGGKSNPIEDATVVYRINNGPESKAEPVIIQTNYIKHVLVNRFGDTTRVTYWTYGDGYKFDGDLAPGDVVDIKAVWMDRSVTAKVVVPESDATITALDTTRIMTKDNYYSRQYSITVQDAPESRNYYFLRFDDTFYRLDGNGNPVSSFASRGSFDASSEPLLHPIESSGIKDLITGNIPQRVNSPMGIIFSDFLNMIADDIDDANNYQAFSNELFQDGSYTIKVNDTRWTPYLSKWKEFWEGFQEGDSYCLERIIKVYSISFEEYLYLRAISIEDKFGRYITEPAVYPSNVEGGLGFVTAATPVTWAIQFPPEPYTGKIPEKAYRY